MGTKRNTGQDASAVDPDADRYPEFVSLLRRIIEEANVPEGPIERLEVTALASGEATYRVWAARAVEPEGGYLEAR